MTATRYQGLTREQVAELRREFSVPDPPRVGDVAHRLNLGERSILRALYGVGPYYSTITDQPPLPYPQSGG